MHKSKIHNDALKQTSSHCRIINLFYWDYLTIFFFMLVYRKILYFISDRCEEWVTLQFSLFLSVHFSSIHSFFLNEYL